jgi:hypothetical protein
MALGFFQQQATDEVRGNLLGELGEEGLVEGCEGVDGFGGWLCEQVRRDADRKVVAGL